MIKLEHVWHFGTRDPALLFLALECIGQRYSIFKCSYCRKRTEHYSGNIKESCYVVCKECGEGSKLVGTDD